ncbi:hypothetical protein PPL_10077 [Heterostelium album PN500]|uniref:Calcium channel flower n=1 Tax=Heterostelium pallidum (strain ATCC 26659 / Pp 5 / PN500) TaxID=670386 RepID=D3BQ94_HETP5|nr:hypothetical protein PPL_10077 [Heterostelium album PN500]EFA76314.1 hypothetical protein PPL_10077 [Heterostelium album PN500]|eukprot:XP_020428446.1 hypothetical protein PPL_10077 [Heterostelium album PN500]
MKAVGSAVGSKVGSSVASSFLPKSELMIKAGKYAGIATGCLLVALGILIIFFSHWIVGPISIALGGFMLILEIGTFILVRVKFLAMVFDYKIRGPIYILFCIPPFFTVYTIAPALGCIITGGIYAVLGWIKNESAAYPEAMPQRDAEEARGAKKSSLSSQGEAPGQDTGRPKSGFFGK